MTRPEPIPYASMSGVAHVPKRPTVIVDVDGTVSDSRHRLHHMFEKPKNRDAFHAKCHLDKPIAAVVALVQALAKTHTIVLLTGRWDTKREDTIVWHDFNAVPFDELHMRTYGDMTPAPIYKKRVLDKLRAAGHNVVMAIEDQQNVVDMWRENGIHCLQTQAV